MNIQDLLPKIYEATLKRKITWIEGASNTFHVDVGERRFEIHQDFDDDSELVVYRLSIYKRRRENSIGQFLDGMYADIFRGAYSDLEELFSEVRRNALGIDRVISEIDDDLDRLLQ